jgi:DNA primase
MRIPKPFIDELLSRLRTSQVVGKRVRLSRAGKEYSGLCPFHSEKSPSFTVNDEKGFYHCFGCGAHGDAIRFVMELDGKPYPEAVEALAAEAGMAVPSRQASPALEAKEKRRKKLLAIMRFAAARYADLLRSGSGYEARRYLEKRGVTEKTAAEFGIGYAPDGFHAMEALLREKGASAQDLADCGLTAEAKHGGGEGRVYDRFRGRLMFPIHDPRGDPVGFGGRLIGEGKPKYLNSPECVLFDKSRLLYNFHRAKSHARQEGGLLVVEGYMDVVKLAQAGLPHAVAPMGTAFGEPQLRMLWQYADCPVVCLDGDEAGKRATDRIALLALPFLTAEKTLAFVFVPGGMDPDEFVSAHGAEAMRTLLRTGRAAFADALWDGLLRRFPGYRPEQAAARAKAIDDAVSRIADAPLRTAYKRTLGQAHWEDLRRQERESRAPRYGAKNAAAGVNKPRSDAPLSCGPSRLGLDTPEGCEIELLALLGRDPSLLEDHDVLGDIEGGFEENNIDKIINSMLEFRDSAGGSTGFDVFSEKIKGECMPVIAEQVKFAYEAHRLSAYSPEALRVRWRFLFAKRGVALLQREHAHYSMTDDRKATALRKEMQALEEKAALLKEELDGLVRRGA